MERPLALSIMAGYITGFWEVALPLGITLELLWLDVVALGSIIQPFSAMAFLLLFPICAKLTWTQPGVLLLPLVLCMMAAHLGTLCELRYRISRNSLLDLVPQAVTQTASAENPLTGRPVATNPEVVTPETLCLYCLVGRAIWHALLYITCYGVICAIVALLLTEGIYPVLPSLDWPFVYAMATIGAVLSLRERRAYMVCGLSLTAIVLLVVMGEALAQ